MNIGVNIVKKQFLFCSFVLAMIFGVSAAFTKVAAQTDEPISGGYGTASVTDKEVRKAAAFAVTTRAKRTGKAVTLVSIRKAEIQVVAGLNYRICMRVREGRRAVRTATAVVYRDLRKRMSLTRWKNGACTDL